MALIIRKWGSLSGPHLFYNGTEKLYFAKQNWLWLRDTPEGLQPLHGVTGTLKIVDKSDPLIRWACRKCIERIKALSEDNLRPDGMYEIHVEEFDQILEAGRKAHEVSLDDAATVGHISHSWVESVILAILNGDNNRLYEILAKFPLDERAMNCCIAAVDFMVRHNIRWIASERKVYSRSLGVAGTMDGLCYADACDDPLCCPDPFKDVLTLVDWKSSNHLVPTYLAQSALYQYAYTEETGEVIRDRFVIRLGKEDGEFDPWHRPGEAWFKQDLQLFLDALELTKSLEEVETGLSAMKETRKAAMKLKALAAKEERLKKKCEGADKYKGIRVPKCNKGNPCETCLAKYAERHPSTE
jgi:hypothetical protein